MRLMFCQTASYGGCAWLSLGKKHETLIAGYLYHSVYRYGPMKFELRRSLIVLMAWIKKTQDIKHWRNCMKGESRSCDCIIKASRSWPLSA